MIIDIGAFRSRFLVIFWYKVLQLDLRIMFVIMLAPEIVASSPLTLEAGNFKGYKLSSSEGLGFRV